jgi:hypothetical protein
MKAYATYFACFLTFAHRFFAPLIIAALPAAERTRFFAPTTSRSADCPKAFAAVRTPFNWWFSLLSCFSSSSTSYWPMLLSAITGTVSLARCHGVTSNC